MTPKTLFNIILKIFGLVFICKIILSLPQFLSIFVMFGDDALGSASMGDVRFFSIIVSVLTLGFYSYAAYMLLFRTPAIITKLKLDDGFDQTNLLIDISAESILSAAIIIISGIILIDEVPDFIQMIFSYFLEREFPGDLSRPRGSLFIFSLIKIIAALLLIGERKRIIGMLKTEA